MRDVSGAGVSICMYVVCVCINVCGVCICVVPVKEDLCVCTFYDATFLERLNLWSFVH